MENYFSKENSVGKAWPEAMKTRIEKGTITFDDNKKFYIKFFLFLRIVILKIFFIFGHFLNLFKSLKDNLLYISFL